MTGEWTTVVRGPGGVVYVDGERLPRYQESVLAMGPVLFYPGDGDTIYGDGEPQRVFTWDEMATLADVT